LGVCFLYLTEGKANSL